MNKNHPANFALLLTALLLLVIFLMLTLHVWEDGSWAIGIHYPYWISGCLPWGICN